MDAPSAQLQQDLRNATADALSKRRPVLHRLSADTAWLLQIPRPTTATRRGGRFYFNILIDPWLSGDQIDGHKWFSRQWHAEKPAVPSIAAVEELLRETEILASGLRLGHGRKSNAEDIGENGEWETLVDAVVASHEFTDHSHQQTFLQVHPDVPVFAVEKAAAMIETWNHFRVVQLIQPFPHETSDWHATSIPPLPEWIGISRLVSKKDVGPRVHTALLITFNNTASTPPPPAVKQALSGHTRYGTQQFYNEDNDEEVGEAIVYTPHGIPADELSFINSVSPPIRTLALLHGIQEVYVGRFGQINLGARNGLKTQRLLKAKYWFPTHDEVKYGVGIIGWLLRRKYSTVADALREEVQKSKAGDDCRRSAGDGGLDLFEEAHWVDLKNGESRVLL